MGYSRGRALLFALVSGALLEACSGVAIESSNGAVAADGGSGSPGSAGRVGDAGSLGDAGRVGDAGSLGDAGSPGANSRNPNLPAPPDDSCERFEFSEADCVQGQCPPWPCNPAVSQSGPGFLWCQPSQWPGHCLGGFNCEAVNVSAAAMGTGPDLVNCLVFYQPCSVDSDCGDGYCVVDAHQTKGNCESGAAGARCRADDDCQPGNLCIAVQEDGKRACSNGVEDSLCNIDAECQGQRCFHEPGSKLVGTCSTGMPGAPCYTSGGGCQNGERCTTNGDICQAGAHCIPVLTTKPTRLGLLCSAGNLGDPCRDDSDCKSRHCATATDSVCTAGAVGDPCNDEAADCEDGFCGPYATGADNQVIFHCTTGEAGELCLSRASCRSKRCDSTPDNPRFMVCVDRLGATGEPCDVDADCLNQVCGRTMDGLVCTAGKIGEACSDDDQCASGFCVHAEDGEFAWYCSNGALNDYCEYDGNCASHHCPLGFAPGTPVPPGYMPNRCAP